MRPRGAGFTTQGLGELRRAALPNGLRVVTMRRDGAPLVGVKLFFKVGSRHDGLYSGIAHFLEHLLLSNTGSPAARTVYETIEGLGGELNAGTTREYTALQTVVLAPHLETVVNLFADLLEPSPIDPTAFDLERRIIQEEIRLQADSSQIIWDLFLKALWDGHPLARPITGTSATLDSVTIDALRDHWRHYLAADRMVLAAAGGVDHDALVQIAESQFGGVRPGPPMEVASPEPAPSRTALLERDTQQTHLVFGVEGVGMADPRRYALRLLDIVLGRGASSRLHRALRSERGLVYAVSSAAMSYADRGYLGLYTSCAPENARLVGEVMFDELDRVKRERVPEAELARAKAIYEGSLARNFETVISLATIIGIEELLYRIEPFPESVARIRAVGAEEVLRIATETLTPEQFAIAVVGRRTDVRGPA
jgi:predicted Zn-dependent peptidase